MYLLLLMGLKTISSSNFASFRKYYNIAMLQLIHISVFVNIYLDSTIENLLLSVYQILFQFISCLIKKNSNFSNVYIRTDRCKL